MLRQGELSNGKVGRIVKGLAQEGMRVKAFSLESKEHRARPDVAGICRDVPVGAGLSVSPVPHAGDVIVKHPQQKLVQG